MTEVIVIGGTFTTSMVYPLYEKLVPRARYIPLPGKGLGPVEETVKRVREKIWGMHLDEPPVLVGHSQGGVIAAEIGWWPGAASAVISLAGPHSGVPGLAKITGCSPAGRELDDRSDFIKDHLWTLKSWKSGIPFHVVNATYDWIVPRQVDLPNATHWVDAPTWVPPCLLRVSPSVRRLYGTVPSGHVTMPRSTGVQWLVNRVSQDAATGLRKAG